MVTVASNLLTHSQTTNKFNLSIMDGEQFDKWVELLGSRIGIRTSALRKTFLTNAINKRLLETQIQDYDAYYDYLHVGAKGELEWISLIDLLTIKETRFYRHPSSLKRLQEYIQDKINDIIAHPEKKININSTIQAWSVGCATGEEAYTIAIIMDQSIKLSKIESCYYSVFASDISRASLLSARKGIYSTAQLKGMDNSLIREYFTVHDNNKYQISDDIKKRVCFTKTNVLDIRQNNIGQMDIIFCQNLLIYFEHSTRTKIVNSLIPHLAPNGLLILGAGEIYNWVNTEMALVNDENVLVYRKTSPTIIPGTTQ